VRYQITLLLLFGFMTLAFSATQDSKGGKTGDAEESVRKLERAWLNAYEQNDAKAMDMIVGSDFLITFPNGGMQTKPQLMDSIRAPRNTANPAPKFYTEDVNARVYGDTVVLTGRVIAVYEREGKTSKEESRYTDTYVLRDGRWQVVASHLSNVAPPKKPTVSTGAPVNKE